MAEPITNVLGTVAIKHCGEYDATMHYEKLNVVTYNGSSYCAKDNTIGNLPTNTTYWDLMAEKGEKGETGDDGYTPVKGTDYYTAEDIADLEATLSDDVHEEVNTQVGSLTSATPLVASAISGMTDTTRVYVNTTDGHWYWYDGSTWQDGGIYQATAISDNEITYNKFDEKLQNTLIKSENLLNITSFTNNTYLNNNTGATMPFDNYSTTDLIEVTPSNPIYFDTRSSARVLEYDSSGTYLNLYHEGNNASPFTASANTKYVRFSLVTAYINRAYISQSQITYNENKTPYYLNGETINCDSIDNVKIKNVGINKINETNILSNNIFNKNIPLISNSDLNYYTGIAESGASNYFVSSYYPIDEQTSYVGNFDRICFYDENLNYISYSLWSSNINSFTTPANTKYYRISDQMSRLSNIQLNLGNNLLPFDDFKYELKGLKNNNDTIEKTNIAGMLHNTNTQLKIVLVGDSITAGFGGTGYSESGSQIGSTGIGRNEAGYCWANLLKESLEDKYNCVVYNNGISGIRSSYIVEHLSDLIPTDSNIAIVMIGTNDRISQSSYESLYPNLETIYNYCKTNNIKFIPMASCPASLTDEERENGTFDVRYKHMDDIENVISAFAINHNLEFIDNFEKFYMFCYTQNVDVSTYLNDGLHPNDNGYYLMFRFISNELGVDAKIKNATW